MMKRVLTKEEYHFDPNSGNITVAPKQGLTVMLIVNETTNEILYNMMCEDKGGKWRGNVLELEKDIFPPNEYAMSDDLVILVNDEGYIPPYIEYLARTIREGVDRIENQLKDL